LLRSASALAAALALVAGPASAQVFPSRTVTIVVPYTAGGGTDTVARSLAQALAGVWGQPVVVENVAGADGVIGMEKVIRSPADGHTILMGISQILLYKAVLPNLKTDPMTDLRLVSKIQHSPLSFVVSAKTPVTTMRELVEHCKSASSPCTWGSATKHTQLIGKQLMDLAGIRDAINVPYKGTAPLLTDVLGNHVTMGIVAVAATMTHHRAGTMRVLNVGSAERFPQVPGVPTLQESGFPILGDTWYGLMVPKDTPPAAYAAIATAVKKVAGDKALLASIEKNGGRALFTDADKAAEEVRLEAQELNALVAKYPPPRD
jgi:tripartite-type tricarboxylate transporter receptor subunit TctC